MPVLTLKPHVTRMSFTTRQNRSSLRRHPASYSARHSARHRGGSVVATLLVLALLAGGIGFGAYKYWGRDEAARITKDDASQWHTVKRQSFDVSIVTTGELNAKDRVEINCELETGGEIAYIVEEGTSVKKGDLLVQFVDEAIKTKIEDANLALEGAKEALENATQSLDIQRSEAKSLEEAAKVKLEMAELDLKKWEKGDVVQKRRELDLALEKAKRTLARAKENVELSKQLYEEEFISKSELEDDELALIEAEDALKTANLNIEVYNKFTFPKEQRKALSDVSQATAELARTQRKNEGNIKKNEATKKKAEESLAIRIDRLTKLQEQLAKAKVLAPNDGLVVYATSVGSSRSRYSREEPIAQGTTVRYNSTVLYLPDTRNMVATVKVHEANLRYLRLGQDATITIDARPGKPVLGTLEFISVMATSSSWYNPTLREYTVKIVLPDGLDAGLKPGMRCSGKIHVGNVEDALAVPVQCVHTVGARRFAYVKAEGGVRRVLVKTGRSSETLAEVTEGLSEGDKVLLRRPRPGEVVNPDEFKLSVTPGSKGGKANRNRSKAGGKEAGKGGGADKPPSPRQAPRPTPTRDGQRGKTAASAGNAASTAPKPPRDKSKKPKPVKQDGKSNRLGKEAKPPSTQPAAAQAAS